LAVLERGETGQIYHLSPNEGVAVRDVVAAICRKLNRSFDESVEIVGERPGQDEAYVIDSRRARGMFGWTPEVSLEEGIEEVIEWIEGQWSELRLMPLEYIHRE
jgi:dTDP-glucose 4,6-dehydratase